MDFVAPWHNHNTCRLLVGRDYSLILQESTLGSITVAFSFGRHEERAMIPRFSQRLKSLEMLKRISNNSDMSEACGVEFIWFP